MSHPHSDDENLSQDARRHREDAAHHPGKPRRQVAPVDEPGTEDFEQDG